MQICLFWFLTVKIPAKLAGAEQVMSGEMLQNLQPERSCDVRPRGVFWMGWSTEAGVVLRGGRGSDAEVKGE